MKRIKTNLPWVLSLPIMLLMGFALYTLAQSETTSSRSSKLQEAVELINDGKPLEARQILTNIPPNDPDHPTAKGYDAIAMYKADDKLRFLKAMEALKTNAASIPSELKQDLAVKEMDAWLHYRKFDELLSASQSFGQENKNSARRDEVAEYRMAALWERGMKKADEASRMTGDQSQQQWAGGKTNLEEFLAAASVFVGTNYSHLKKRDLRHDVWTARITLGNEQAVLEEILPDDLAGREQFGLLRVQLYQKLQPDRTDRNLQMMKDLLEEFPETKSRKRLEFDIASLSFSLGEKLCKEADKVGNSQTNSEVAEKRSAAGAHFAIFRSIQSQVVVDKQSGIEVSDVLDLRGDFLYSYFLEKNFTQLAVETARLLAEAQPGDLKWVMAKVYEGILLQNQTPPQTDKAAAVFDEVLGLGFKNRPDHDYYMLLATKWRIHVAQFSNDPAKARELVSWVRDGSCRKDQKVKFLKEYDGLLTTR